ncbi:STAS domain-containing protein [Streptomyces sp. SBST2-5]|uniref:STAS domain-containing protein n=1 Tax=Streptomyces composti TaxID=2720025 RepID=A0ABX1A2Y7_9ACTN|nr:STAS domain-containing protein [Streptomyces composti]NJP49575.1 STAS domain-containing protein [Streptomyces composti]
MTGPLTLTPGHAPAGATRLTVAGEIDMSDIGTLAPAIETTQGPLIVDLTAVDHLDSAGLSVLFRHADRVEIVATPLLAPVLTISGLTRLTTVHGLEET